jgi:hypothetical protein
MKTIKQLIEGLDTEIEMVCCDSAREDWQTLKNMVLTQQPHNSASTKLRKIIIELGCRGVIGASERDTAIVDEICKREGVIL